MICVVTLRMRFQSIALPSNDRVEYVPSRSRLWTGAFSSPEMRIRRAILEASVAIWMRITIGGGLVRTSSANRVP